MGIECTHRMLNINLKIRQSSSSINIFMPKFRRYTACNFYPLPYLVLLFGYTGTNNRGIEKVNHTQ